MRFIKAVIHKHDAFRLARIQTLEIDFTQSSVFVILGTNGSGKSSLREILLDYPDDSNRYDDGGYKHIDIEHNGHQYHIRCEYNTGDKYHFSEDRNVLYQGSHGKMFAETVYRYLGLSKLYKSLLLEKDRITEMNAAQRSAWLMDVSGIDYTWAMDLYERIKSKRNTYQGSAKINAQRLAQMTQEAISAEDSDRIKNKHTHLSTALNFIHRIHTPDTEPLAYYKDKYYESKESFEKNMKKLNEYEQYASYSEEDIKEMIRIIQTKTAVSQALINEAQQRATHALQILGVANTHNQDDVQRKINTLQQSISDLKNSLTIIKDDDINQIKNCTNAYKEATHWIADLSHRWQTAGAAYSAKEHDRAKTKYDKDCSRNNQLKAALDRISTRIEHYQEHLKNGQTQCPKCQHNFFAGYNESDHNESIEKLATVKALIAEHTSVLMASEKYVQEQESLKNMWYEFSEIGKQYPPISVYLSQIMQIHLKTNTHVKSLWERLGIELLTVSEIKEKTHDLNEQVKILDLLKQKSDTEIESATIQLQSAKDSIQNHGSKLHVLHQTAQVYEKLLTKIKQYKKTRELGLQSYQSTQNALDNMIESHRKQYMERLVVLMQQELGVLQLQLKKIDQFSALVEGIQYNLEQDKLMVQCWSELAKAVGPKEGVIGQSLVSFLEEFVDAVNEVISHVWTYDLTISAPISDDTGEFDPNYRFGMQQESKSLKDISKGSTAMLRIVDMSFRLVAISRLIDDPILILDEPFAGLDESHRPKATQMLKELMLSDQYQQMFIISHYADMHDTFTQADVICLDSRNITVPSNANERVRISYE